MAYNKASLTSLCWLPYSAQHILSVADVCKQNWPKSEVTKLLNAFHWVPSHFIPICTQYHLANYDRIKKKGMAI